ncbi:peptide-methionine (S)-S-oxide reductase [Exophiala dermatitidis NIH/UT8656]|uniref:Peptide-methionine (S)-S-oxide reductase n=1 Tax=Exophiala dermatitidis (strain ATCC 34100 / CBS 525.76 / NIH/UT8656) TaxID=858893 RepID=H6BZ00_EXODN|nr:peptide-methionine (S)-S-oxide reductase [Exophiala dermatitidis NIH/UT8656]EHY56863.1 peptide-methionine (S)-S-oxide reductase [Exophiala dermatitidis NIH/UT8656]
MAIANESDHVYDVMAEALNHLSRVVEHLRDEGENEAANDIARDVHSMLDTFNTTTGPWDMKKVQMKPLPAPARQPIIRSRATSLSDAKSNASTWAAVAATDIPGNNRLIKFRPSDALKRQITNEEPPVQPKDGDYRCVWIYGWTKDKPLSRVSERITTGAIFSMAFVEEYGAVCVIFQFAHAAVLFFEENARIVRDSGASVFGPGVSVKYGEPYPETADIRRMAAPANERRRLTFARSQLFTNGMNEERFKNDLIEMVGRQNVELVWLFNTGNATAVFSSTVIARIVREEFLRRSKAKGPYHDVGVGFSHDPCERPMNLITQIPCPGTSPRDRSNSSKSGSSGKSTAAKVVPGAVNRGRKGTDPDGWQTVHRKR